MEEISTYNQLINKYIREKATKYELLYEENGANNKVQIYQLYDNNIKTEKISFRSSIDPLQARYWNGMVPVYSSEIKVAYDKDKKNWENAHKEGLSPHLYLYGYYKEKMKIMHKGNVIQERYNLYKIIISEAYDMSLYTYYNGYDNPGYLNSKKETLSEIDINIANQLIELIIKLHNNLKLICFDIKPANCVIKLETNEVKLIDWDGDWCVDYNAATDEENENIKLLSIILFANHFFLTCKWNIFYDYLHKNKKIFDEKKEELKQLFCSDDLKHSYQTISNSYFFEPDIPDCHELFDQVFNDSFILKYEEDSISEKSPSPAEQPLKRKRTEGGRSKIRRQKKTKRKNKKTKRKNKKTKRVRM